MQNEREHGTERSARAGAQVSERLAEAHLEDKDARAAPPAVHSAPCRPTRRGAARQTLESFYYIFSLMVSP